jgi:hypothetical protein
MSVESPWLGLGLLLLLFCTTALYAPKKQLFGYGRITGTVVNSDGEPIAQATICTTINDPH